jgi:ketosteroid isomerase-like protein
MNRRGYAAAAWVAGICLGLSATAQEAEPDRDADHDALRALRTKVTTAINGEDVETLQTCFTREFVFTPVDQTVITNRAGLAAYYNRIFKDPESIVAKLETEPKADILTRFTGPDTGYCYGHALDRYTMKNGRIYSIPNRWTALVRREDGAWKIEAAHVGVNFIDNPVLEAASMGFWRKVGVALGLVEPPWERE